MLNKQGNRISYYVINGNKMLTYSMRHQLSFNLIIKQQSATPIT